MQAAGLGLRFVGWGVLRNRPLLRKKKGKRAALKKGWA